MLGTRPAYAQSGEIPVGLLFSLTGAVAVVERTLHDAALLAIEEINASGGVHGMQLKTFIEDPASDPATYADRARRLMIRDECVSVFGSYTSASRQAVLPVVESRNNLYWYPTCSMRGANVRATSCTAARCPTSSSKTSCRGWSRNGRPVLSDRQQLRLSEGRKQRL